MSSTTIYLVNDASMFDQPSPQSRLFPNTRWKTVARMNSNTSSEESARRAFNDLCTMYWYPIYAYIRTDMRRSRHDAEDLTQGYFAMVVEKDLFKQIDRKKGKLRTFISLSVKRFVIDVSRREHALKRGEGLVKLSLDIDDAEDRLAFESYQSLSPDEAFDRRCLMSIFEEIFAEIESSYSRRNELEVYHAIAPYFAWGRQDEPHASVAEELGMTAGALRMRISRVRSMVETRLRKFIRQTVNSDAEVDEEIDHYRRIASKY